MLPVYQARHDRIVLRDGRPVRHRNHPSYRQIVLLLAYQSNIRKVRVDDWRGRGPRREVRQQGPVRAANTGRRLIYQQTQPTEQSASVGS